MEPALYAKPIVVGPSMENFRQIVEEFLARGGIRQIHADPGEKDAQACQLTEVIARLLRDPSARETLGKAAYSIFEGNRGATQKTVEAIAALFPSAAASAGSGAGNP
jgi:3-deoxy-D-manno-octulosonic-acid transferase